MIEHLAVACLATIFSVSSLSQGMTCCSTSLWTGSKKKPESCSRPYTVPVSPAHAQHKNQMYPTRVFVCMKLYHTIHNINGIQHTLGYSVTHKKQCPKLHQSMLYNAEPRLLQPAIHSPGQPCQ